VFKLPIAQISARRAALAALAVWRTETRFSDVIIGKLLTETRLAGADRGFALELFYGVLRNLTLLDFWIDCLRSAPLHPDLRDVLRLGIYQLFCLDTPPHAAVFETVELVPKKQRGVANAILRNAIRQRDQLHERARLQPLFVRRSHPQFLVARWEEHFGVEAVEELCAWNNEPPSVYGRINGLKITPAEFLQRYKKCEAIERHPGFVEFHAFPTTALKEGHCYIQDPSTSIACELLKPEPCEKVLDVCAAPGGKTSYLAELMKNRGSIVACDRDPERVQILNDNIERLGIVIAKAFRCDWESDRMCDEVAATQFDRILVDAPCSNTGTMRRRVDVRWRLHSADFSHMQKRQLEIVRASASLLKPGGILVYSTCSLEPEENEHVVQHLVRELSILRLEEEKRSLPFRDHFDGAYAARLVRSN
jgi:16S rRNA (cytosine967-C5)-methyltransferase